jgi:hypothetical protein
MRTPSSPLLLAAVLALPACNSLRLSEKVVQVETSPPGAMVNLNGLLVGTAPCSCTVHRSRKPIEFDVLPPRESTERLWTQHRTFTWDQLPAEGAVLYFDLRLEATRPVQPFEVRDR